MSGPDNSLIKKAYSKTHYTRDQFREVLMCTDPEGGPLFFMKNFFYIQHPLKGQLLYDPYDFQEELIDCYNSNRFSINLLSRQTGKTTTAAGYLLWYAMFVPQSTILVASNKYSSVLEIMHRIRYGYEMCPNHIRAGITEYNKGNIGFDNGSRIIAQATTETTGRGLSISLLYLDEFAFVRPTIAKEFWTSISPTLSTGGKAIITSTPNSDDDQFAELWKGANIHEDAYGNSLPDGVGINGFKAYEADWRRHPDRDEQWAIEERNRIGEERFQREHENKFVIFDETLISSLKLAQLEGKEPIRKTGEVRWYHDPKPGLVYVVALDPSIGTGRDNAAIQVFEADSCRQIAEWKHNKTPIPDQIRILVDLVNYLGEVSGNMKHVYYTVENNSIGEAALISLQEYGEANIGGVMMNEPRKKGTVAKKQVRKGFTTTNKTKLEACAKLKTLVESGVLELNSKSLISELKQFIAVGASYAAKPGEKDDLVMSLVLVVRMLNILKKWHINLDKQLTDHGDNIKKPLPIIVMFS